MISRIIIVLEFEDVMVLFDAYVYIVSLNIAMNVCICVMKSVRRT